MTQITIGELLRRHRIEATLTQKQLASAIDYHNSVVSRVETGKQSPSAQYLERVVEALCLSKAERREVWALHNRSTPSPNYGAVIEPSKPYSESSWEETVDVNDLAPFVVGPPIIHPRQFFGREQELKQIFGLWKRFPLQNVAVIGLRRSGKTSLLHYLKNITTAAEVSLRPRQRAAWLPNPGRYRWVLVNFQNALMQSREGLLQHLLLSLEMPVPRPCDLPAFMDLIATRLRGPTIILMDEIGAALLSPELDRRFWESLRSLVSSPIGGNLGFLLTSQEFPSKLAHETGKSSPFFNIFGHTITLDPLLDGEARELIASSPRPFSPSDVEWIIDQSERWPALLQLLCHTRLTALENGNDGDAWREEGLHRMRPYRHLLGD